MFISNHLHRRIERLQRRPPKQRRLKPSESNVNQPRRYQKETQTSSFNKSMCSASPYLFVAHPLPRRVHLPQASDLLRCRPYITIAWTFSFNLDILKTFAHVQPHLYCAITWVNSTSHTLQHRSSTSRLKHADHQFSHPSQQLHGASGQEGLPPDCEDSNSGAQHKGA